MNEEIAEHLKTTLQEYQRRDYALAYVLSVLRSAVTTWLYEQRLDPNTYSHDQLTLLAVQAICDAGMRIN